MKIQNASLTFLLICSTILFTFIGYFQWSKTKEKEYRYQQVYKAAFEAKLRASGAVKANEKIPHLLKAMNYLNIAIQLKPEKKEIQKLKFDVQKKLIILSCETENYQQAELLVQDLMNLSILSDSEKENLQQLIKKKLK